MRNFVSVFACLGLILAPAFQTALQANETAKQAAAISNIALGAQGTLKGRAVDGQGKPLSGAKVTVSRDGQVVTTVVTTEEGHFQISGLTTGLYGLQAGQGQGTLRVWEQSIAPPSAKKDVLIVSGAVARAQGGLAVDPAQTVTLGLAVTGVVLGAVALSDDSTTTIIVPVSP